MCRGGAGPNDGVFVSALHDFILPHSYPALHDKENFFTPSLPLGALWSLTPPCKTLFFVNLSYN